MTGTTVARACPPPAQSSLVATYGDADLADAFAITLPAAASNDPERLARFMLARPPRWLQLLLATRDRLVSIAGIRSSSTFRRAHREAGAASIDFFRLYAVHPHEAIFGENDRHLDFRTSVLIRAVAGNEGGGREIVSTTVVHCHNRVGKLYLATILPFHRLVVRSALVRAARRGWPSATNDQP